MTQLRFSGVACQRGARVLFENISFALAAGDALVVSGPNGVGKSSLLRLAGGLLAPVVGSVMREGAAALADEHMALDPARALIDALGFWALLDGGDAMAALASVGMDHLARVPVRMLSTGQRRRATLARTIASRAPIWLLDEPANGLDSDGLAILEGLVAAHRVQGGIAVVASHQPLAIDSAQLLTLG
ncbi:MAG: heme ABC exporter ATP-binding protein CcmA [Sphingomonadaceae bacterium]